MARLLRTIPLAAHALEANLIWCQTCDWTVGTTSLSGGSLAGCLTVDLLIFQTSSAASRNEPPGFASDITGLIWDCVAVAEAGQSWRHCTAWVSGVGPQHSLWGLRTPSLAQAGSVGLRVFVWMHPLSESHGGGYPLADMYDRGSLHDAVLVLVTCLPLRMLLAVAGGISAGQCAALYC